MSCIRKNERVVHFLIIDKYSLKVVFSILALALVAAYVRNDEQLMA